ncbi:MAG: PepSY domain-containing protein, partial [Sphingomonadaceae bacterium]|nr:PepSY domain-containing protein [Sphingomonadaceae bacterium]
REMRLPDEPGGAVGFFGQADALLVRDRVNGVWIDPADGRVVEVTRGETLSLHQRISELADPLHFGTWGGMATKIIWFIFGAAMTVLSITGVMIYSLRLRAADAEHGGTARAVAGMGLWRYPAIGLVLVSLAMIPGWLAG